MSLQSLSKIRSLKDPLKQLQCEFILCETPGLLLAKLTQKAAGLLSGNTSLATPEELHLRCTSFSIPSPKMGQSELIIGGHRRKLGTIQNKSGVWKCKIIEDMNGGVVNIIQAWMDLIHSNMLGTRVPSLAYVGLAEIRMGEKYDGAKPRSFWLKGLYPISYRVSDIDCSSSEAVTVDVEFNYDYFCDNSYSVFSLIG